MLWVKKDNISLFIIVLTTATIYISWLAKNINKFIF